MSIEAHLADDLAFGPVELDVILFEGSGPSPALLSALAAQVQNGNVRLLDFVVVTRSSSGVVAGYEIDAEEFELAGLELHAPGLAADEDLEELSQWIPDGASAAIVAFELLWAKELAQQLASDGSVVIATERIPAPAVNAAVELATGD